MIATEAVVMKRWLPKNSRWIWLPGEEKPSNAYARFARRFTMVNIPETATVHISADCKYLFYINGEVMGRGPVTTDPEYKQVDVYKISGSLLRRGENVIAALVLHRQNKTSRLYPVRGGFILQFDSEEVSFGTDGNWKARWAVEYKSDTPYMTHQYGQQEWCDGRKIPSGWESAGFDDSKWDNALTIRDSERYWPRELELRAVPHMLRERICPAKLVSFFGLSSSGADENWEPARSIMNGYPTSSVVAWNPDNIVHPENGPAVFQENQGDGVGVVVDMGEEMYGFPFIDIECPAGATVDIGHGEILSRNRIQTVLFPGRVAEQRYADRYITREGRQRFEIFDSKGCRYLEIHFNKLADFYTGAKVIIHGVGIMRSRPPIKDVSCFECSDPALNSIWNICLRTALVKCQDWHICDAQREQNNWPEIFQDMLYFQSFGRVEMVRQMIHQFCRSQLKNGFILSTFPMIQDKSREDVTEDDLYIFSTIAFPLIIYLDWLYGGADNRQPYWLDCCSMAIEALLKHKNSGGILTDLPGCNWVEWSGLDARDKKSGAKNSWEVTVWNAFMILMLEKLAEMAEYYGKTEYVKRWREEAEIIRKAAGVRFWSEKRGAYIDGIYDGIPSVFISQSTNAMAVLARMGDEERLERVLETTENSQECDVPSAINMMAMYHEALQSMDMDTEVIERIKRKWEYMLEHGATTTWEGENALEGNGGLCFGFAGHPLNYMARTILGITPLAPGYSVFSIRVDTKGLDYARGEIVTPTGMISVEWEDTGKEMTLNLRVPEGCRAIIGLPRTDKGGFYSAGEVCGKPVELHKDYIASCTFLREKMPVFMVNEGEHKILFSKGRDTNYR